ncbi:hypothetical protein EON78_05785 [bacterium]|nr:MAG: hypothetical protein EON78_05785 [bacterium]
MVNIENILSSLTPEDIRGLSEDFLNNLIEKGLIGLSISAKEYLSFEKLISFSLKFDELAQQW